MAPQSSTLQVNPKVLGFNEPFGGSFVTSRHYHRDPRVKSMVIEVKRSNYMDESTGEPDPVLRWKMMGMDQFMGFACGSIAERGDRGVSGSFVILVDRGCGEVV